MMHWMLSIVLSSSLAGSGEDLDADAAAAVILEAAGIVPATGAEERDSTGRGAFRVPHFVRLEWTDEGSSPSPSAVFLPIPGLEWYLDEPPASPRQDGYASWRWDREVPSWASVPAILRLHQAERGPSAEGSLSLALPAVLLERGLDAVRVLDVLSGCAMRHDFEVPFTLSSEPVELRFSWDLHSLVRADGVFMGLVTEGIDLPRIPIALKVDVEPLAIDPPSLEFRSAEHVTIDVRPAPGRALEVTRITSPACVQIVSSEISESGSSVRFEETEIARRRHHCFALQIDSLVGDDPEPFLREVRVVHQGLVVDEEGHQLLHGAFAPGERVDVVRDPGGAVRLAYPDRVPCLAGSAAMHGSTLEASLQIPIGAEHVDERVEGPSGVYRIRGRVDGAVFENLLVWGGHCER